MPTPSGFPTSEDLQNAQKDVEHLGRVVNSEDASGAPIDTSTNRTGGTNKTLDALQAEYQSAIQAAGGVPLGTWSSGVTYNAYNEYLVYNGIPYKPAMDTPLPYTAQGSDPTDGPDEGLVIPFAEVTRSDLEKFTIFVGSVAELVGMNPKVDGQVFVVDSYYSSSDIGGGRFKYKASTPKSGHNGITVISSTVPWSGAEATVGGFRDGFGEADPNGNGCFIREGKLTFEACGASPTDSVVTSESLVYALENIGGRITVAGRYKGLPETVATPLPNTHLIGDGTHVSGFEFSGTVAFKSPVNMSIINMDWMGEASDSVYKTTYVSNYNNFAMKYCRVKGWGGKTKNVGGSTAIYLYAAATASTYAAVGNSTNGRVCECEFDGDERLTSFGVRIYTDSDAAESGITLTNTQVVGGTFTGFNWNAVEIYGPNTSGVAVLGSTAELCGLCPFEIDKGAHDCQIRNITINRLLGNIDTDVNPNTRAVGINIQGRSPSTDEYSYNNVASGIVINLLADDLESYAKGASACAIAYAYDCHVYDVVMTCDRVPDRGPTEIAGLAMVSHETTSNCSIRNIQTKNASCGVVQTGENHANLSYTGPNRFVNLRNDGTMTGELVIQFASAQSGARAQYVYDHLFMKTDLSDTYLSSLSLYSNKYGLIIKASGSSSNFSIIKNSGFEIPNSPGNWFCLHQTAILGLENVSVIGAPVDDRIIHSEGSGLPSRLGLYNVTANFGQDPIDCKDVLQNIDQTVSVTSCIQEETGLPFNKSSVVYASAAPSYPTAANWSTLMEVQRYNGIRTAGSFKGWVQVNGAWKQDGTISA